MKISDQLNALVSPFFRNVREAGLLLKAVGSASIASNFAFSETSGSSEGYLSVAGRVLAAVSQLAESGAETLN